MGFRIGSEHRLVVFIAPLDVRQRHPKPAAWPDHQARPVDDHAGRRFDGKECPDGARGVAVRPDVADPSAWRWSGTDAGSKSRRFASYRPPRAWNAELAL
jgi:hypothetical protein